MYFENKPESTLLSLALLCDAIDLLLPHDFTIALLADYAHPILFQPPDGWRNATRSAVSTYLHVLEEEPLIYKAKLISRPRLRNSNETSRFVQRRSEVPPKAGSLTWSIKWSS